MRSAVADSAHPSIGAGSGNGDGVVKDGADGHSLLRGQGEPLPYFPRERAAEGRERAGRLSVVRGRLGWRRRPCATTPRTGSRELWGAYNNHAYQIWELWIKRADTGECMRVGYLNDGKWEWGVFNQKGVNYDYRF